MKNSVRTKAWAKVSNTLLALLVSAFCSSPLFAQAPPSGDTFVSSVTPKVNYGPGISLLVGPGTTSYVQFNLSGIPAGATINKASLRLYVDAVGTAGKFDVYQLSSSWNENTLTYNTPPPPLGVSATGNHPVSVTAASCNQFLLIDITTLAQGWVNGTIPNNGVALALTSASGSFSFDSKESLLTANGPELEIVLMSQGPQGPQGPAGPQGTTGSQGPTGPPGATGPVGPSGGVGAQGPVGPAGPQGPQGLMGMTGPQGAQGPQGVDGAQGPQGAQGTTGQGFNFRGAFDGSASYSPYDVVSFNGSSYVAKSAMNPGDPAPDSNPTWSLLAQQGAVGPTGAIGPVGPLGPMGSQGPQGVQGIQGPQGPPGTAGGNPRMFFSAFAPGPLNTAYTPTSVIPDEPVSLTRLTVNFKSFTGPCSSPAVVRVTDGTTGQDIKVNPTAATSSSGPFLLPFAAGSNVSLKVLTPPGCLGAFPSDANFQVEYKMQDQGDTQTCAASALTCGGICLAQANDPKNCGACGNACVGASSCQNEVCTCERECPSATGPVCATRHANGLGQTFDDCRALGTYTESQADEAADAYSGSAVRFSDGWSCSALPVVFTCATDDSGTIATYCWIYSGSETGWVISGDACTTKVATWN